MNQQAEGRFILDTPGNALVSPLSYYFKQIRVVSTPASVAGHTVITDRNNVPHWEWFGGDTVQSIEKWYFDGFKLTVLDGGIVYLETK